MSQKPLSAKRTRFVAEYLVDLNARQAAIRAGYSPKTAEVQGPRLLGNAQVSAAIQAGQRKKLAKLEITAERVLMEVARIAFSDIRAWFDDQGRLKPIADLSDDVAAALGSVELQREKTRTIAGETVTTVLEDCVVKVKAWDKGRALELLAKHFGLVKERVEHSGPDGGPIRLIPDAEIEARIRDLEAQLHR